MSPFQWIIWIMLGTYDFLVFRWTVAICSNNTFLFPTCHATQTWSKPSKSNNQITRIYNLILLQDVPLGLEYLPPLTMTFKPPNVTVNVTVPWDGAPADSEVPPLRPTLRANSFDLVTPHGGQPTWFHLAKQEWNAKQIYILFFCMSPFCKARNNNSRI